jgi:hypothetical protein
MRIVFTSINQPGPPTVLPSWSGWGTTFPMNCRGKIIPFPPLRHFEIFERHRLRNDGTDAARTEQAGQGNKEMDKQNDQIAHRRIVAGREIRRKYGQNNNSPATGERIRQKPGRSHACKSLRRSSRLSLFPPAKIRCFGNGNHRGPKRARPRFFALKKKLPYKPRRFRGA